MPEGKLIVQEARRWLGVRWLHQGRDRSGVDCAGFCMCVATACGLNIDDCPTYPRRQDGTRLMAFLADHLQQVQPMEHRPGDVAVFKDGGYPIHLGFLAAREGHSTVIHAHAGRRKVIEEPLDIFGRPFAVFRLKERI